MMEKYKILIVEDDVDLREGLSFSFSGDGYDVTETGTKKDGLQEIANGGYDIVFLDCNLPDGTGFELCKEVRSYSNIPIIMLTARDTEMDEITLHWNHLRTDYCIIIENGQQKYL